MNLFSRDSQVSSRGGDLQNWREIETVLTPYASQFQTSILVTNPHGEYSELNRETTGLHIRFWSCPPTGNFRKTEIDKVYGIHLDSSQRDAVDFSGMGIPIFDSEGVIVAEYLSNTLYVLFDLPHGDNVTRLMSLIMEAFAPIYQATGNPEALQTALDAQMARLDSNSEKRFLALCSEATSGQVEKTQRELASIDEKITEAQTRLVTLTRRRHELRLRLEAGATLVDANTYLGQLALLKEISATGRIMVLQNSIIVPVGPVYIEYENITYDIGTFQVVISPDGEYGGVRCINLSRTAREGKLYHPHVQADGSCCLGTVTATVIDLLGQADFASLVLVMIDFLHSYNPGGAYSSIDHWPIKNS